MLSIIQRSGPVWVSVPKTADACKARLVYKHIVLVYSSQNFPKATKGATYLVQLMCLFRDVLRGLPAIAYPTVQVRARILIIWFEDSMYRPVSIVR